MPPQFPDEFNCPLREVLDRIGDKWSVLVIDALGKGTHRFSDLQRGIDGGISQRMLTRTLRSLERDGLVTRTVHPEVPPRVEYDLTPLGRTLRELVRGLVKWSGAHLEEVDQARAAYDRKHRPSKPVRAYIAKAAAAAKARQRTG